MSPTRKYVDQYHLLCEVDGCSRQVSQREGAYFERFTTCKRHRPASGYVVQVKRDYPAVASSVASFVNLFGGSS
jgi:hypothetical protein